MTTLWIAAISGAAAKNARRVSDSGLGISSRISGRRGADARMRR
jgi:hypothetical protein